MNIKRDKFLAGSVLAAGSVPLVGKADRFGGSRRNMCGYGAPKLDKIRVGIIGLGMRGKDAVKRLGKIRDVEIAALCDLRPEMVEKTQQILTQSGRPAAKTFSGTEDAWKALVALDLDLVYTATPWRLHAPICVYSMQHGKHAATEVPAGLTIDECWELVETSEKTGKHCMMLENCCYDFFEMQTFNMVRQGVFGELTHAEGAYIHTLCGLITNENGYQGMWRFNQNNTNNGNLYPTHGLGPIAQCMEINRSNKFNHLVSMQSREAAFTEWAKGKEGKEKYADLTGYRGDMNTTLIKCARGETIMVQHDVSTPRPYSRIHLLQGSKGMARKWPKQMIALGHAWQNDEQMKELKAKYEHPLSKTMGEIARKVGGHGGMDFIMDYRLIYSLKNGLPLDQDVYDAAAWSSVFPLSIKSVANDSRSVKVPDFTRGAWKANTPLAVVDVDPAKLPLVGM